MCLKTLSGRSSEVWLWIALAKTDFLTPARG